MTLVDLSHALEEGMPVYPGLPAPSFPALWTREQSRPHYEGKAEFLLTGVDMPGNTGTYLDSPFHRFPDAADLADLQLASIAGLPGMVVDARGVPGRALPLEVDASLLAGRAVLFRTEWDVRWATERYWEPGPYLPSETVEAVVAAGPALVGVDFANVDDTADPARPAHTGLLRAGIPIVEHLCNLERLPPEGFRFYAVPPRIVGGASFPVRAFAEVPDRGSLRPAGGRTGPGTA